MKQLTFTLLTALILLSCDGVYFNVPERTPAPEPLAAAIDYRFPEENDSDISPAGTMMISFTQELADETVNESTVFIHDTLGNAVPVQVSLEEAHIILINSIENLEENSIYLLTLSMNISGIDGLLLGEDISWSFRTGTAEDTTAPRVITSTPRRGDTAPLSLSKISITFSEALTPGSVHEENISLKDKEGNTLPASVSYRSDTFQAVINLSVPLEKNSRYTIQVQDAEDLEGNRMEETWREIFSTGLVQESETGISCRLAEGNLGTAFNNEGIILRLADGTSLLDSTGLTWGDSIAHLMDHNTEGPLDSGTCLRLVVNGTNIAAPDGLNLKPILKRLTETETPPPDTCYIDPLLGRFVLPRPLLWSAMDSINEVYAPRIKPRELTVTIEHPECMTLETDGERTFIKLENYAEADRKQKYVEITSGISYDLGEAAPENIIALYSSSQSVESKGIKKETAYMLTDFSLYGTTLHAKNGITDSFFDQEGSTIPLSSDISLLDSWFYFNWTAIPNNDSNDLIALKYSNRELFIQSNNLLRNNSISISNTATSQYTLPSLTQKYFKITSTLLIDNLKVWHHDETITSQWLDAVQQNFPEALHPMYGEEYQYRPADVEAVYYFLP